MQHQQQQQMQAQQAQAQQQQSFTGMRILRLHLLADHLGDFGPENGKNLNSWQEFVDKHFHPDGRLLHSFADNPNPNNKKKTYEVLRPTIARYFYSYFESGAQSLRLHTEHANEMPMATGRYQVYCKDATLSISYANGARLDISGSLNALFAPASDVIECLEIEQTRTEELISRAEIEKRLNEFSPVMDTKSPKMAKNKLPKAQQKMQQQRLDGLTIDHFPKVSRGTMGVATRVQQFLEVGGREVVPHE
jgi:hypothetical protein